MEKKTSTIHIAAKFNGSIWYQLITWETLIKSGQGFDASGIDNPEFYLWGHLAVNKIYFPINTLDQTFSIL